MCTSVNTALVQLTLVHKCTYFVHVSAIYGNYNNKYIKFKKLVGCQGTPELKLLAVVIVLFAPILHETLTNSNFDTNTICQLNHGS